MFSRHELRLVYTAAACILVNLLLIVFSVFGVHEATVRAERWRVERARLQQAREERLEQIKKLDENVPPLRDLRKIREIMEALSRSSERDKHNMERGVYGNYLKPMIVAIWLIPVACIPFVLAYKKKHKATVRWKVFLGLAATVFIIHMFITWTVGELGDLQHELWIA